MDLGIDLGRRSREEEIDAVRRIVLGISPAIREGIEWNVPSSRTEKEYFATFNLRARDCVQLIFHLAPGCVRIRRRSPPPTPGA